MRMLIKIVTLLLLVSSCINQEKRLSPYRWDSVSPEFDELTLLLEKEFRDDMPVDSLRIYVEKMDSMVSSSDSCDIREIRNRYWYARLLQREGLRDSALAIVRSLLTKIDSVNHTYEFFRTRALLRNFTSTRNAQSYSDVDEEAQFYASIDDKPMLATCYITLGTSLYPIGELEKSLEYLRKADEIHSELGFEKFILKNSINIAGVLFRKEENEKAAKILLDLLERPEIVADADVHNIVLRNLYVYSGDVKWLLMAYNRVIQDKNRRDLEGLFQALLSRHYYNQGQLDSANIYSRKALKNIDFISDYGNRAVVEQAIATTMEMEGKNDSAVICWKKYVMYSDSDYIYNQEVQVLRMANMREVSLAMMRENEHVQSIRFNYMVILFIILILSAVVYIILYRREKRHEIASRDSRLEVEKSRRHLLAVMLAMEEKNNLFNSLKSEIELMRKDGTISVPDAVRLENSIKLHLAAGEEWDTFQELFIKVNPDFVSKLHEAYPDLSDTYIRLATYIYMGLDNNKIARLLVIRPESVKQARWRLRKMMGLDKDVGLDEAIRSLG